jgi:hypothetical protein
MATKKAASSKLTAWRQLVKTTYHEGKNNNKNYTFRQALKDAAAKKNKNSNSSNHSSNNSNNKKGGTRRRRR